MVADRLSEAIRRIEALEAEVTTLNEANTAAATAAELLEAEVSERLETASRRLEAVAREMSE